MVEEFKLHAREKKFVVRDFTYNEEVLAAGKSEITKLVTDKKKQFVSGRFFLMFFPFLWFNAFDIESERNSMFGVRAVCDASYVTRLMNVFFVIFLETGSARSMVESQFQRNILCMDPC